LPSEKNTHADILANLLYVTVGFSLVVVVSSSLKEIRDINSLWQAIISFAVLVLPSVLFIMYIKTHKHEQPWLLVLDYLFLFFVSAYAFSLTPEGSVVKLTELSVTIPLTNLSVVFMLFYPLTLQISYLKSIFPRDIPYSLFVITHERAELGEIEKVFWLLALIGLVSTFWEISVLAIGLSIGFEMLSAPGALGSVPESSLRTLLACVWTFLIPTLASLLYHVRSQTLSLVVVLSPLFLTPIFRYLYSRKTKDKEWWKRQSKHS